MLRYGDVLFAYQRPCSPTFFFFFKTVWQVWPHYMYVKVSVVTLVCIGSEAHIFLDPTSIMNQACSGRHPIFTQTPQFTTEKTWILLIMPWQTPKSKESRKSGQDKPLGNRFSAYCPCCCSAETPWAPEHPSYAYSFLLCFNRSPPVSGGAILAAFYDHLPLFLLFSLLFEHTERKYVFVLLILHLFLYFLQLYQCDSCCYLWGAFFFPTFKISLYNSESHAKFLHWNSKPNQADLISK